MYYFSHLEDIFAFYYYPICLFNSSFFLSSEVAKFQLLKPVAYHSASFCNVLNCFVVDIPSLFEQQIITSLTTITLYGILYGTDIAIYDAIFRFIVFLVCSEVRM